MNAMIIGQASNCCLCAPRHKVVFATCLTLTLQSLMHLARRGCAAQLVNSAPVLVLLLPYLQLWLAPCCSLLRRVRPHLTAPPRVSYLCGRAGAGAISGYVRCVRPLFVISPK